MLVGLFLSGGGERTYRLLRQEGDAGQPEYHSPTSQYGQLSRHDAYQHLDVASTMREIVENVADGSFADEWDAERDAGHTRLAALKQRYAGPDVAEFERELRRKLGPSG